MSKTCFVICPIGSKDSDIRKDADTLFDCIIDPAVKEFDYVAERADHIPEPGKITTQVIDRLVNSDLVIADLTGHNPNVFYELAVRHAVKKPFIQIIKQGETIPFDIAEMRTIFYDLNIRAGLNASSELKRQLSSIKSGNLSMDSPINSALIIMNAMNSLSDEDSQKTILSEVMSELKSIRFEISKMKSYGSEKSIQRDLANEYFKVQNSVTSMCNRLIEIDTQLSRKIRKSDEARLKKEGVQLLARIEQIINDYPSVWVPDLSNLKFVNTYYNS